MMSWKYGIVFLLCVFPVFGNELEALVGRALSCNPLVEASRKRVEQSKESHREVLEFMDPSLYLAGGRTQRHRSLPLTNSNYRYTTDNAYALEGGVEIPLEAGATVNVGGAMRQTIESDDYSERFYQHLVGLQISIPLMKDRGFAVYNLRKAIALAEYNQCSSEHLAVCQDLRHRVELAYIAVQEAQLHCRIRREAVKRFLQFQREARELARMKTVANYEVSTATIELQIGHDDCEIAEQTLRLAMDNLVTLIGDGKPVVVPEIDAKQLTGYKDLPAVKVVTLEEALGYRGEAVALREGIKAADFSAKRYEEEKKDELRLNAGFTYQGDGKDYPTQSYRIDTDQHWGGEVMLVWTRPLGKTGELARIGKSRARRQELTAEYEHIRLTTKSLLLQAQMAITSAQLRVEMTQRGIQAALDTVKAEQERFKNGEGSSKAVLDSQKNVNTIYQRLNVAYSALMKARADYAYAAGYPVKK